jgi:hypothetical protein
MSLTDTIGSLAVATKGQFMTGVSTDLGASFVKPAGTTGDILTATAVVTAMGMLGFPICLMNSHNNSDRQVNRWLIPE